jgi:hypothetical protein
MHHFTVTQAGPPDARINCCDAALQWLKFGYLPIPLYSGKKVTSRKWNRWLKDLSPASIRDHYRWNPDHEVGFIVGPDLIVFDTDTVESQNRLYEIETDHGVEPALIIQTTKGFHHHFGLADGVVAKSDAHSSDNFPEGIDVKTGRAMVALPPSTGKIIQRCEVTHSSELTKVTQAFVDSVARNNGRPIPRQLAEFRSPEEPVITGSGGELYALLSHLDPSCGYRDWFQICAALHHHTGGSETGLEIFDRWSQGGANYAGSARIERMWRSLVNYLGRPITIASIYKILKVQGLDPLEIRGNACPNFDTCVTVVIDPAEGAK